MSPEDRRIITDAIIEKLGPRKLVCPISGDNSNWEVHRFLSSHPAIEKVGEDPNQAERGFPVAVLMCKDCGYSLFINLIQLGLAGRLGIPAEPDE